MDVEKYIEIKRKEYKKFVKDAQKYIKEKSLEYVKCDIDLTNEFYELHLKGR